MDTRYINYTLERTLLEGLFRLILGPGLWRNTGHMVKHYFRHIIPVVRGGTLKNQRKQHFLFCLLITFHSSVNVTNLSRVDI